MLVLYEGQEELLKKTISKYVHAFHSGKVKSNYTAITLTRQFYDGYQKKNMKGFVKHISIERTDNSKYYVYYTVDIVLKDNQKHTYYVKIDKNTNRIEYR